MGVTTVRSWFLLIFTGSLFAGFVGTLWTSLGQPVFFLGLSCLAAVAGLLLQMLDQTSLRGDRRAVETHAC